MAEAVKRLPENHPSVFQVAFSISMPSSTKLSVKPLPHPVIAILQAHRAAAAVQAQAVGGAADVAALGNPMLAAAVLAGGGDDGAAGAAGGFGAQAVDVQARAVEHELLVVAPVAWLADQVGGHAAEFEAEAGIVGGLAQQGAAAVVEHGAVVAVERGAFAHDDGGARGGVHAHGFVHGVCGFHRQIEREEPPVWAVEISAGGEGEQGNQEWRDFHGGSFGGRG